ncbi:hypothetical protein [Streptomyces olivaceiscleroticus]|uniref:hypothetical protein n=1 Tax=Streptomyces olivaceiscleroticus TaxID=68245 RepID=UPI0031F98827
MTTHPPTVVTCGRNPAADAAGIRLDVPEPVSRARAGAGSTVHHSCAGAPAHSSREREIRT